jgi:hypothetical protein
LPVPGSYVITGKLVLLNQSGASAGVSCDLGASGFADGALVDFSSGYTTVAMTTATVENSPGATNTATIQCRLNWGSNVSAYLAAITAVKVGTLHR